LKRLTLLQPDEKSKRHWVLVQFEDVLMVRGLQPSSDGFPEGLIDQRFLALGQPRPLTISTLPACF